MLPRITETRQMQVFPLLIVKLLQSWEIKAPASGRRFMLREPHLCMSQIEKKPSQVNPNAGAFEPFRAGYGMSCEADASALTALRMASPRIDPNRSRQGQSFNALRREFLRSRIKLRFFS
jgi:hypothetical protein